MNDNNNNNNNIKKNMKSKTERVFLWDKKIHLLNSNQIRFPIASRLLSGIPHLTFGGHEFSSKLHANGKVVSQAHRIP